MCPRIWRTSRRWRPVCWVNFNGDFDVWDFAVDVYTLGVLGKQKFDGVFRINTAGYGQICICTNSWYKFLVQLFSRFNHCYVVIKEVPWYLI